MASVQHNKAWRRDSPCDNSPDGRSEISLLDDAETLAPAWKRTPKSWLTRRNVVGTLIVVVLVVAFMAAALYHKKPPVKKTDPNITILAPHFFPEHKSERVTIRYGPFTAPAMDVDNGMEDFQQMADPMPCTDCLITWMQAGLTYEDGSEANVDTGMWLHHTVFSNMNRSSVVCPDNYRGDRFFASGNERTPIDICVGGTQKAGYYIAPDETLGFILELMNMAPSPRAAYLTMTFEYIPDGVPKGFSKAQSLWLDIGGCRTSEMPAKPDTHFDYTGPVWTSDVSGHVTFMAGHLHDGGTRLEVVRNGEVACVAVAEYGTSDEGKKGRRHGHEDPGMDMGKGMHISSMSTCENVGRVESGDEWTVTAHYDTAMHKPMVNADGSLEPVMGIALIYLA